MKKLFRLFSLFAFVGFASAMLLSCHGQSDDPIDMEVPEGVLRIFADKTTIAADGSDLVTFTVKFGSEDVSNAKTLQLIRTCQGVETLMPYGVNSFSTVVPGEYSFKAEYYNAGKYYTDNEVEVVAKATQSGGSAKKYVQRVLGFQFTSVGCTSCPTLSANLKAVQNALPGRLVPVSFHQDFGQTDPMTHPMTQAYYKLIKRQGLPQFNANLIINDDYITVAEYSAIVEMLDAVAEHYPATCGVAVECSEIVDDAIKVAVRVTSNIAAAYRYQIFLLEDGINEYQAGAGYDYIHNNVVVATSSDSVYGDRLNEGMAFQSGVEVSAEKTIALPRGCNRDNLRIVVAAFNSYDGGNTYVVNNCTECAVGESVDYAVAE